MKSLIDAELWVPVLGYEGLYEVSSFGRIRSLKRFEFVGSKRTGGHFRSRKEKILKVKTNKLGYSQVGLYKDGFCKRVLVHRVVLRSFTKMPQNLEVNHLDGDKGNNKLSNLECSTRVLNSLHSTRILGQNRGSDNARSKLTESDVLKIKTLLESGSSQTEIAKKFNVSNHAIFRIQHGYNWSHITGYERKVGCDVS